MMLAASILCGMQPAIAQVAATDSQSSQPISGPQRNERDDQIAEIVVTAQKRSERIQDIPISVTAISGAELQAQGISDVEDAARQIPGVAEASAGPGQTQYTIRGLSSSGPAVSTVGFYLDDVPMTAPSGAQNGKVVIDPDLYDLNRIEVLRGPQGTLYGSGSMGGTIKLVTNQPDLTAFAASTKVDGSGTAGGGFNRDANVMLNIPLIEDKLALRIVATDKYTSGWIDDVVVKDFPLATNPGPLCGSFSGCTRGNVLSAPVSAVYHDVNDEDLRAFRGSIRYQPTDQFSATLSALYQTLSQGGPNYVDVPPGATYEAHYVPFEIPEPFSDTFRLYNLVANYAFPAFTVTSASSYWTRSESQTQNVTEGVQTTFDLPSVYADAGGTGPVSVTEIDTTNQFSQEIRLTSTGDSAFQWLVGGFYSNYNYGMNQYYDGSGIEPVFGTPNLLLILIQNRIKQVAEFGEVSYKITDDLKATVGLRHYSYDQDSVVTVTGAISGAPNPVIPVISDANASDSGFNPKYNLSYNFTKDFLVYGTVAKGFRPGAGNAEVPTAGPDSCLADLEALGKTSAPSQYYPDSLWSYELGGKATLWDKRLTIDAAVYYERWSEVQETVPLGCGYNFTDNAGTAAVRGGELEIDWKIASSWTLQQSGGYVHAVSTSAPPGSGVTTGERLLNVPDFTASTSLVYSRPIDDQYTLVARASNVIVGNQIAETFYLDTIPGYDIAKARIGVVGRQWSTFLFVDNLTDKKAILGYPHNYWLDVPSFNRVSTNQPRAIGLSFEFNL